MGKALKDFFSKTAIISGFAVLMAAVFWLAFKASIAGFMSFATRNGAGVMLFTFAVFLPMFFPEKLAEKIEKKTGGNPFASNAWALAKFASVAFAFIAILLFTAFGCIWGILAPLTDFLAWVE